MERYEEYKDSGVEWIGGIPAGWEVRQIRFLSGCNDETLSELTDPELTIDYIDISSVVQGSILQTETMQFCDAPSRARRVVRLGDVIVSTVRTYLKAIAPITTKDDGKIASTGFAVLRPQKIEQGFFSFALMSERFVSEVESRSTGVNYPAISASKLIRIPMPLPPLREQQEIASYLRDKVAEIDSLVEDCEREVELLREYRKAVISEAVTKGLDPNAPMKDSGIDWIGEIPEEWMLSRVKNVTFSYARIGFRGYRADDLVDEGEGALTLSPSNLAGSGLDLSKVSYLSWCKYEESPEIQLGVGDVLLTKTGSSYGKTAYITKLSMPATINPQLMVFKRIQGVAKYFYYLTCTDWFQLQIERCVVGGTIPTISQEAIRNMYICWPDSEQQDTIVAYLDTKTAEIDSLIADYQSMADKLREYRKSLISEAVTGKFKVPGVA